ncbi:hypothetical protein PQ478_12550 [Alkalihalophilus pseudofirmus]|uniref:hypothetical protein n=1 Tax=Alkalihalophilus pseudofirmus TaxID=79885 RepID=UPI00259BCD8F|nr:hypothetical protein [Alkalihalophilus pseudofirmus]WEG15369.1 hypothetical protein PQ478_12550 [Alkalihalophilus pseudofirmus]
MNKGQVQHTNLTSLSLFVTVATFIFLLLFVFFIVFFMLLFTACMLFLAFVFFLLTFMILLFTLLWFLFTAAAKPAFTTKAFFIYFFNRVIGLYTIFMNKTFIKH